MGEQRESQHGATNQHGGRQRLPLIALIVVLVLVGAGASALGIRQLLFVRAPISPIISYAYRSRRHYGTGKPWDLCDGEWIADVL